MEKAFTKPFEFSFPTYICPDCHNYGKYDTKVRVFDKDCIYLQVTCLHCIETLKAKCKCFVPRQQCYCIQRDNSTFQIKVSIKRGKFDILISNELLKKQKANYIRLVRFLCNAEQSKNIMFVTNAGHWTRKDTLSDIILKQYDDDMFSKLKFMIFGIKCACMMYNLPIELGHFICQFIICLYY